MSLKLTAPKLSEAYETLRVAGARGRALAVVLEQRGVTVQFADWVTGGFTLNAINRIFLQPLRLDHTPDDFKFLVALLAHEACHAEQGFWVDSVEQEVRAYQAQCAVAAEIGLPVPWLQDAFGDLNPSLARDLEQAYTALVNMFAGQPAATVYASLPLLQPRGLAAVSAGAREIAALVRAGMKKPNA